MFCSWTEDIFINLSIFSKLIYEFNANPTKISIRLLLDLIKQLWHLYRREWGQERPRLLRKWAERKPVPPENMDSVALGRDRAETPEMHTHTCACNTTFTRAQKQVFSINNWKIIYIDKNKIWLFPHNIYKSQLQMD